MEKRLVVLLVEDDRNTCEVISKYIQGQDDMELAGVTNNSSDAIQYVKDTLPDAVILDLELHNGGGNGLLFLSELNKLGLRKHPYITVTTNNSSNITLHSARKLGADFDTAKYESNYTPQYAVDFLSHIRESILSASPAIESSFEIKEAPKEMEKRLIRRIHRELDLIGISPKVIGYKYLTDAILMIIQNPSTNISQFSATSIRRVIPVWNGLCRMQLTAHGIPLIRTLFLTVIPLILILNAECPLLMSSSIITRKRLRMRVNETTYLINSVSSPFSFLL